MDQRANEWHGILTLAHNHAGLMFNILRLAVLTEVCIRQREIRKFNHRRLVDYKNFNKD